MEMFSSGLELGHNGDPGRDQNADCWGQQNLAHHNPFAPQRKSYLPRTREKEKTLCAPRGPQKVLVVELLLLYPMYRMPLTWNTVLTAHRTDLKRATYSPFDCPHPTTQQTRTSTCE